MAQIRQVVSETLQATVRRLLPSQQGFTEDLQASNVITPIIDLTPSAEGTSLPTDLQSALGFTDITSFQISGQTDIGIIDSPGFWRVFGASTINNSVNNQRFTTLDLASGLSSKQIVRYGPVNGAPDDVSYSNSFDFVIFLQAGEALTGTSNNGEAMLSGNVRQLADISGNLINPTGYSPQ